MSRKGIAIVGGGIGGIATAIALRQAGVHVVVYERAERLAEVGAGMMLWPNATRILREFGVLDQVIARSGSNTHFLVRTSRGTTLMNIALGCFDVPAVCMRRSELLDVLAARLPRECLRLGRQLQGIRQRGSAVELSFKDGSTEKHDAVVGADGIRSRIRAELFGAFEPRYRGYTVWRGLARYEGSAITPGFNSESWGSGKRFGILNTGHRRFTWYATVNGPAQAADSRRGQKDELQKLFAGWHRPVSDFLEATDEADILRHSARDCAPLRRWGHGRVTLLGDAAHPCTPNLGQGGCMALEDALVLAKCIRREQSLDSALRQYESMRMRRTRHIQKRSRLIGQIGQWQNSIFVSGREIVTRMLPAVLIERNLRRVYSYHA